MVTCQDCIHYDVCQYHITEETSFTINECGKFLNNADVVVKHGKWVSARPSGDHDFYCSCCKEFAITYEDSNYEEQYCLTDYCPNCGAKMDLEVDE